MGTCASPRDYNIVTCKWVFTLKFNPDDSLTHCKARLVARGFTQAYGLDYIEAFSLVVRLNFIYVFLSLVVNHTWSLYQLSISNAFFYSDLKEQVFIEQTLGYVAQGGSSQVWLL